MAPQSSRAQEEALMEEKRATQKAQEDSRAGNAAPEPERDQVKSRLARPLRELLPYEEYEEIPFTD